MCVKHTIICRIAGGGLQQRCNCICTQAKWPPQAAPAERDRTSLLAAASWLSRTGWMRLLPEPCTDMSRQMPEHVLPFQ
jgi:hypothetical protein